jgi:putative two-component system response regulator
MSSARGLADTQVLKFAGDLVKARRESRESRHQLAETNGQLERYAADLRTTVANLRAAKNEVEDAYLDTIHRLVIAAEYKDRDTGNHISRISACSGLLARRIDLDAATVKTLAYASPMHDIGKIGIPDRILMKDGTLLPPEFELMKCHTVIGATILGGSKASVLQAAEKIALYHHERWDGTGYPQGLAGTQIPLIARIVALADTFDALMSKRSYKEALSPAHSFDVLKRERGRHFDPALVDAFLEDIDEVLRVREECEEKEGRRLPALY